MVQRAVQLIPWTWLEGTVLQHKVLRALGARIGERVHIHRGVPLLDGGWDLLEIGDDATLGQDSAVRICELDDGDIVMAPVTVGAGATLDIRSSLGGHSSIGAGAWLNPLSSLPSGLEIPAGERWDGIPAGPIGIAPVREKVSDEENALSPLGHSWLMIFARALLVLVLAMPAQGLACAACIHFNLSAEQIWAWMFQPTGSWLPWVAGLGSVVLLVPSTLVLQAALMRLMGRVPAGVISRWSPAYVRVWLKTGMLESAGRWLSGTLMWPLWLRAAGMRIGKGCEVSTITDVVPEHVEIGAGTFFADGIYLGGPRIQQGVVTLAETRLRKGTFLGNHVVVAAGQELPGGHIAGCLHRGRRQNHGPWDLVVWPASV